LFGCFRQTQKKPRLSIELPHLSIIIPIGIFYYICFVTKADRTRQYIIEHTAPLFNKKGFDGTSLQDMMQATDLTKGALYGNFADKEEIARAAFRYSVKKVKAMVRAKLDAASTSHGQLLALLDFYASYVLNPPVDGGCPLLNYAIEADDHRTAMRRTVAKELNATVNFIQSLISKGIRSGEFKAGTDARKLAYIFFCSIEGALMFARVERDRGPMDIVVNHCKELLKQICK
jgi:TetR/AcrR family transcriptional regulator, transcriptional repressor for nem operon